MRREDGGAGPSKPGLPSNLMGTLLVMLQGISLSAEVGGGLGGGVSSPAMVAKFLVPVMIGGEPSGRCIGNDCGTKTLQRNSHQSSILDQMSAQIGEENFHEGTVPSKYNVPTHTDNTRESSNLKRF
ncbi:hypothetical protein Tco_1092284 [Tanacetum coccineum]|uniref:Uncharacterized protein n=1 Tax=Tanacetum coccineum TaxID=301880 RepID=A0ABQ5I9E6_9ASTR